jgi:hypothetical protein
MQESAGGAIAKLEAQICINYVRCTAGQHVNTPTHGGCMVRLDKSTYVVFAN